MTTANVELRAGRLRTVPLERRVRSRCAQNGERNDWTSGIHGGAEKARTGATASRLTMLRELHALAQEGIHPLPMQWAMGGLYSWRQELHIQALERRGMRLAVKIF